MSNLSRPTAGATGAYNIFQPAAVTSAFLKMGIMGKQGAGKSKTAAKVAIGLIQHLKKLGIDYASKPVAFFDTETGSDWLIPDFEAADIQLVVAKKKSFADLLSAVRWAEQSASALIIDSVTHPWRELQESYLKKKQRSFMQIDDWGYIKGVHGWAQFTDLYVNSNLHIIMCGRAGDETEQYTDENGKRQFEKVGVKMKTEGETGFEPSLLVLMEREMDLRTNAVTHRATVLKDRSTKLDGAEFDDPGFENFLPHIKLLNLGGGHLGVDASSDSQHILTTEKRDWQPTQRRIVIDKINDLFVRHGASGTSGEAQKRRSELCRKHLGTASKTEIEDAMSFVDLREGYNSLHAELEGAPSEYAVTAKAENASTEMNDSLPDHSSKEGAAAQANAQSELTLEQKLIADLVNNKTPADCLKWSTDMTNAHRSTLGEAAFLRVNEALSNRLTDIFKEQAKQPPNEGGEGDKPAEPPKEGGSPPQSDAPPTDLSKVDPKTGAPEFLTRQPKPDTKPKGKAKAGGDSTATAAPALQASADVGGMYGLINA